MTNDEIRVKESYRELAERESQREPEPLVPPFGPNGELPNTLELGERACRSDPTKLLFQLIPPEAEKALATILTYGAQKYAPRGWEKGLPWSETIGSLRRHLNAFMSGEIIDPESGLPHVYFILTNAAFLVTMVERRPDLNDLPWGKDSK